MRGQNGKDSYCMYLEGPGHTCGKEAPPIPPPQHVAPCTRPRHMLEGGKPCHEEGGACRPTRS